MNLFDFSEFFYSKYIFFNKWENPFSNQGLVKGTILCFRNLYFYFRHGESTSTASQLTSPASQKSKDLNKVPLLLPDLDPKPLICISTCALIRVDHNQVWGTAPLPQACRRHGLSGVAWCGSVWRAPRVWRSWPRRLLRAWLEMKEINKGGARRLFDRFLWRLWRRLWCYSL